MEDRPDIRVPWKWLRFLNLPQRSHKEGLHDRIQGIPDGRLCPPDADALTHANPAV